MEPWERAIWPCARNPSLLDEPRKVAKEEGVEKIRLINIAVAEKLSVLELNAIFVSVGREDVGRPLEILDRAGAGNPQRRGDEVPSVSLIVISSPVALRWPRRRSPLWTRSRIAWAARMRSRKRPAQHGRRQRMASGRHRQRPPATAGQERPSPEAMPRAQPTLSRKKRRSSRCGSGAKSVGRTWPRTCGGWTLHRDRDAARRQSAPRGGNDPLARSACKRSRPPLRYRVLRVEAPRGARSGKRACYTAYGLTHGASIKPFKRLDIARQA